MKFSYCPAIRSEGEGYELGSEGRTPRFQPEDSSISTLNSAFKNSRRMSIPQAEVTLIKALRTRIADALEDSPKNDNFLLRFIRVRNGDLDAAEKMIRTTLTWRRENNIDSFRTTPLNPIFMEKFPIKMSGRDKAGRPVVTLGLGRWDFNLAAGGDEESFDRFKTYNLQVYEKILAALDEVGAYQYIVIYDWDGFGLKTALNLTIDRRLSQIAQLVETHYPETLAHCFYINCSSAVYSVIAMLKTFISTKTFAKIQTFGTDRGKWGPAILSLVDASELTPEFGGTKGS